MDKKRGILITRQNIVDRIEEIQTVFNLHDVWRVKNPNIKSFMWSQKSPLIFCRLDYWLISDALFDVVRDVDIILLSRIILLHVLRFTSRKWRM